MAKNLQKLGIMSALDIILYRKSYSASYPSIRIYRADVKVLSQTIKPRTCYKRWLMT